MEESVNLDAMWTLSRLDAQKNRRHAIGDPVDSDHLEILEAAGYITAKASHSGGWLVHVLPDGQEAAVRFRRDQVAAYTQPKAKA